MAVQSIFISSVQKELEDERRTLKAFIEGDPLLHRFYTAFIFEEIPASDRTADDVYLSEVDRCAIYVGIFGNDYGNENSDGFSSTEREFIRATERGKTRLIFVKGTNDSERQPKMQKLVKIAGSQLIRRRFESLPELTVSLYASLVEHLEREGTLRTTPFDAAACVSADIKDISDDETGWFLEAARRERVYVLSTSTPKDKLLIHLNMLEKGYPVNAAILLFGNNPQKFIPASLVKCLHFHGIEVQKPIPSYQTFNGTIFKQIDAAVNFVMSKIDRNVGTRDNGPIAPVTYEIPRSVIAEAIVNAVAHRDYTSNSGVQVMLFSDRVEVWNPGELPVGLTPENLRIAHPSVPRNPLLSEPLFLAHYIERAGTGTLDMITQCNIAELPEPVFEQRGGQFVITIWRHWLTHNVLAGLNLNDRQYKVIIEARSKIKVKITNTEYQKLTGATKKTATRDLDDLVNKGVFQKKGKTGRGTYYVLSR